MAVVLGRADSVAIAQSLESVLVENGPFVPERQRALDRPDPFNNRLFDSPLLRVGSFRAPAEHPGFRDAGQILRHLFVFPRTSVWIEHDRERPFVADPNVVTYYNRGQAYRRAKISEEGDRCEWFAFDDATLRDAVSLYDPGVVDRPDRPFPFCRGPSDSRAYLQQRRLVEALASGARPEPLRVEETMLAVLARLLSRAYGRSPAPDSGATRRRNVEIAEAVRSILARRFRETLSLSTIAGELSLSPFHLCRAFRQATGSTIRGWRNALRLRHAVEVIQSRRADLTGVALELGFSSHSHFSAAFRRQFGLSPSLLRRQLGGS
jgi:AraC family transcriptional regulator